MTPKNETPPNDSLKQVLSLEAGIRRIDMRDYVGLCVIGYHERTNTYYWTWDNWTSRHGPFPTATEAFLSWEKCWNKTTSTRVGWPPESSKQSAPVPTLDPTRWTNRCSKIVIEDSLAPAKQECREALGRVIVRQTYPGAKVSHIAGSTYRVNIYEQTTGIVPINRLTSSFLVDVIDGSPIRRPEVSKKLINYSDRW